MRIFSIVFFAALAFFCLAVVRPDSQWLVAIQNALPFGSQDLSADYQARFQESVIALTNEYRSSAELTEDGEIQTEVSRFIVGSSSPGKIELNALFETIQERFPETQAMSATMIFDPRDDELKKSISEWSDTRDGQYESLSVVLFNQGLRRGALAILSTRMERFDLANVEGQQGRFYRECPLCGESHAIELEEVEQTLILKCPHCNRRYDMIAGGSDGRFRHAPEFFDGFGFEADSYEGRSPFETMKAIWKTVLRECEYEHDRGENRQLLESWKTPEETWKDRTGDCEDTSILLCDALLSAGIEARVAVGRNIHIGDHAWCVARVDGKQYVLESTGKDSPRREPANVSEVKDEFQPEQLFDREQIYFSKSEAPQPCGDYWDPTVWMAR